MRAAYKPRLKQLVIELILTGVVFIAGFNSQFIEYAYSNGIYGYISSSQRFISSLFPFPLGDFLYILFVFYILLRLYIFFRKAIKKRLKRTDLYVVPLQLINFILILYIAFKILWGLNYSRPSISAQLGIGHEKYTTKELVALGDFLIHRLNQVQVLRKQLPLNQKSIYTIAELQSKAVLAYKTLAAKNTFFKYKTPVVKAVLNSWMITKIGLEGYYNPLSGEANVNMRLNTVNLPFVTCHEISHQLGIGREDEANLIAYLVSTASPDLNFQYSGYYCVLKNVLFEIGIKSPLDYERLRKRINATTLKDFKSDIEFWRKYNNDMFGYMEVTLDQFLKLNNQYKGTDSYQDIVLWLYNIHRKEITSVKLNTHSGNMF